MWNKRNARVWIKWTFKLLVEFLQSPTVTHGHYSVVQKRYWNQERKKNGEKERKKKKRSHPSTHSSRGSVNVGFFYCFSLFAIHTRRQNLPFVIEKEPNICWVFRFVFRFLISTSQTKSEHYSRGSIPHLSLMWKETSVRVCSIFVWICFSRCVIGISTEDDDDGGNKQQTGRLNEKKNTHTKGNITIRSRPDQINEWSNSVSQKKKKSWSWIEAAAINIRFELNIFNFEWMNGWTLNPSSECNL